MLLKTLKIFIAIVIHNWWNLISYFQTSEYIDWHNYDQITLERSRKGPGEQGIAFYLPPGTDKRKDELYKVNGFNGLASDYIAINRSIADIRHKK